MAVEKSLVFNLLNLIADITSYSLFRLMNHIYFTINANDFEAAVGLFAPNGALQPPFQKPIIGREKDSN